MEFTNQTKQITENDIRITLQIPLRHFHIPAEYGTHKHVLARLTSRRPQTLPADHLRRCQTGGGLEVPWVHSLLLMLPPQEVLCSPQEAGLGLGNQREGHTQLDFHSG